MRLARRKSKPDCEEVRRYSLYYCVMHILTPAQHYLATKVIPKEGIEEWQHTAGTLAEAAILMRVSHKNIVKVGRKYIVL